MAINDRTPTRDETATLSDVEAVLVKDVLKDLILHGYTRQVRRTIFFF